MITQGKWEVKENQMYAFSIDSPTNSVAFVPVGQSAKANARLIAAAPELLEACKDAKRFGFTYQSSEPDNYRVSIPKETYDDILAAIAKATT